MLFLPKNLKMKCVKIASLTSSTPMDLDLAGEIFHVTRENADDGYHIGCREIHAAYAGSSSDSSSIFIEPIVFDLIHSLTCFSAIPTCLEAAK